eukprot:CAMPEP_0182426768 /NCGR_PEP_ID=MMETSP1167-20130531/13285_1 /TAXON_ID=2988 /ORGANISM="Mallomonas Sp, Strain CCMP3275" /LENGTH=556 /DNA_ID=CAMNT_0024608441 /DNA_START=9 /DNA_END=1679 /DNA_ORIENTATION=-
MTSSLKVFIEILSVSRRNYGDGGWFSLLFAVKLILLGLKADIPLSGLIIGYHSAMKFLDSLLLSQSCIVKTDLCWSDAETVLCLIRSVIQTNKALYLSEITVQHLSINILSAFLSSLHSSVTREQLSPCVCYCRCPGLASHLTTTYKHAIVMDMTCPTHLLDNKRKNMRVALFDCSLELASLGEEITVEISSSPGMPLCRDSGRDEDGSIKSAERRVLECAAELFVRSGVGLVGSQRRIHPRLVKLLSSRGVLVLPRLSVRFITSMQQLSGAKILGHFSNSHVLDPTSVLDSSVLGFLSSLRVEVLGGRRLVVARTETDSEAVRQCFSVADCEALLQRRKLVSTVVIAMPSSALCEEMQVQLEGVVQVLSDCISHPQVLPGGGCWQHWLATRLKRQLLHGNREESKPDSVDRAVMCAIKVFAEALEQCALVAGGRQRGIDETTEDDKVFMYPDEHEEGSVEALDALEIPRLLEFSSPTGPVLTCVRSSVINSETEAMSNVQIDDTSQQVHETTVISAQVLDAFLPSVRALQQAVEAAVCLLQADAVLELQPQEVRK